MNQIKLSKIIHSLLLSLPILIVLGNFALNTGVVICILLFFYNYKLNKLYEEYKKIVKYSFLVFLFFIINILNSTSFEISAGSFLGFFKSILLIFIFYFVLKENKKFFKNFSRFLFWMLIIISIDGFIQYFFGKNILGYEIISSHGKRLGGFFGKELILGSYLTKLLFISLLFLDHSKYKIIHIITILYFLVLIFLTNERMASVNMLLATIIFFTFNPYFNIKKKLAIFFITILLLTASFLADKNLKKHFIDRTFDQIGITHNEPIKAHYSFWDSQWGAHFLTSIEIWKDHPFLGSGLHTFRKVCSYQQYENIKSVEFKNRCNTHPHNFYLEILSELGLPFLIIFILLHIYFFLIFQIKYIKYKTDRFKSLCLICSFFILFQPIQTTGAYFSSTGGFFYIINYAYFLYYLFYYKPIKKLSFH